MLQHRCLHHPIREAAARCPECRLFFCRECVTEHEGRVICTSCLKKLTKPLAKRHITFAPFFRSLNALIGLAVATLCFYVLGQVLLRVPTDFHEGTLWERQVFDEAPNP